MPRAGAAEEQAGGLGAFSGDVADLGNARKPPGLEPEAQIIRRAITEARPRRGIRPLILPQQLRQLGDVRRDPPRLVAREQLGCGSATRLTS
jgi:hypothetical protein